MSHAGETKMEREINSVSWEDQKITISQLKEPDEMQLFYQIMVQQIKPGYLMNFPPTNVMCKRIAQYIFTHLCSYYECLKYCM